MLNEAEGVIFETVIDLLTFTWICRDQKIDKAQDIPGDGGLGHDRTQYVMAGVLVISESQGELLGVAGDAVHSGHFGHKWLHPEIQFVCE
jgi:hypothetical protein